MKFSDQQAYFDSIAMHWDADPSRLARAQAVAAGIRRRVPLRPEMNGFEFGCGTGLLSLALHADLAQITLADSSSGMLDILQQKIDTLGLVSMRPLKLNLDTDPLPEENFDLVYALMSFHHVQDTDRLLYSLRSLLKSPGYLCVADLDSEDGSFHGTERVCHNGFDRDELAHRVARVGFRDVDFETIFTMHKTVAGLEHAYPVFLMVAAID